MNGSATVRSVDHHGYPKFLPDSRQRSFVRVREVGERCVLIIGPAKCSQFIGQINDKMLLVLLQYRDHLVGGPPRHEPAVYQRRVEIASDIPQTEDRDYLHLFAA